MPSGLLVICRDTNDLPGLQKVSQCLVLPVATGMGISLVLNTLKHQRYYLQISPNQRLSDLLQNTSSGPV